MKKIKIAVKLILLLSISLSVVGCTNYEENIKPVTTEAEKTEIQVTIPNGSSIKTIAKILEENGMIRDDKAFIQYCKETKIEEKLKAGDYRLSNAMDVATIADKLVKGIDDYNTVKISIPEGYEIRQIADKLEKENLIDRSIFMDLIANGDFDYDFVSVLEKGKNRLEGYLFPATYDIYIDATEEEIIDMMLKAFDANFNDEIRARAKEREQSINEVITMASIVEREAQKEEDRKIIAGVFYNRIKQNMMLQSCATVQYILEERKEVLLYKDLEIESPYNTYKYAGLPPAPIASPGKASIEAALYPEDTDFLFFFAKKDGSHIFTKTYEEHLAAQKQAN